MDKALGLGKQKAEQQRGKLLCQNSGSQRWIYSDITRHLNHFMLGPQPPRLWANWFGGLRHHVVFKNLPKWVKYTVRTENHCPGGEIRLVFPDTGLSNAADSSMKDHSLKNRESAKTLYLWKYSSLGDFMFKYGPCISINLFTEGLLLLLLSRFSCVRLCDPIESSPPGSPSPRFSRQEYWSGLPFPSPMHESEKWKKSLSRVWLLATPWTAAYQAPLSMGFSRQEYWSGVPSPSPN